MTNLVFFIQNDWAFGNIHNSLIKLLYSYGIIANILPWNVAYRIEDVQMIDKTTDIWVTNVDGIGALASYKVPIEKMYVFAHAEWDLLRTISLNGYDIFNKPKKFAVVSNYLKRKALEFCIERIPEVLELGVFFDYFYAPVPQKLEKIGYCGAWENKNWKGVEIKRGRLVRQIAKNSKLPLIEHQFYHWIGMPSYYKSVDCVFVSSLEEGASLPILETSASGRLLFSTNVGYFQDYKCGIELPFDENEYVKQGTELVLFYHLNPEMYQKKCLEHQEIAKYSFDWSKKIEKWAKFFLE